MSDTAVSIGLRQEMSTEEWLVPSDSVSQDGLPGV